MFAGKYLASGSSHITLLDMGGLYPNNAFTIAIPPALRDSLTVKPEIGYRDEEMCFEGRVVLYKDKPQMLLHYRRQIITLE